MTTATNAPTTAEDDPGAYELALRRALRSVGHPVPLYGDVALERAMHDAGLRTEQEFLWHIFMPQSAGRAYTSKKEGGA